MPRLGYVSAGAPLLTESVSIGQDRIAVARAAHSYKGADSGGLSGI